MSIKPVAASPTTSPSPERFLIRALLGCLLGSCIGLLNLLFLYMMSFGYRLHDLMSSPIFIPILCALCGIIAGAIQGGFLRRATRPALLWLLLSALGWSFAGFALAPVFGDYGYTRGAIIATYLLCGALAALPQWFWLQRSHRNAAYWLMFSEGVWALVMFGTIELYGWYDRIVD
jgi:hypothetical protein